MPVPRPPELYNPLLAAIRKLGGSASIEELDQQVIRDVGLTDMQIAEPHNERYTKIQYNLAWAKTHLKVYGALDSNGRGVWFLTSQGQGLGHVDPQAVARAAHSPRTSSIRTSAAAGGNDGHGALAIAVDEDTISNLLEEDIDQLWREELLARVLSMRPDAFERLCQRLLREAGFVEVTVKGRPGDGGIDGVGVVQLGGHLSFPAYFQCKRYQGAVGSREIRDFRGAMAGRGNHGLFITTGSFTPDARREATRDGVSPIDLIDGERLIDKLKELGLGVEVRIVEEVTLLHEFFEKL
jgi:restriction system protein